QGELLRPVGRDGVAYARVGAGEGGVEALFRVVGDRWEALSVGELDCEAPPHPVTPGGCASLVAAWQ
ncbi:MAG: hypothetical protein R3F59_39190, partial [Myxococcota bacterium]